MDQHRIVSREDWLAARKAHLASEKELTRHHERVGAERRALPWVEVDEAYVFDGPEGQETLAELFGPNSQLIVYHFMFAPGWTEGCHGCSFLSDHIDGANLHLKHHDVTLLAVSRAPWRAFQAFKKRMGWDFKWVSSAGGDFNYDYGVAFTPEEVASRNASYNYGASPHVMEDLHGISVFFKDEAGTVFHTYSSYARGVDILLGAHNFLDLTPKGRNERSTMDWMKLHDRYDGAASAKRSSPVESKDACCAA